MVARINEVNSKKSGQPSNVLKTREKDWNCHFCEALGSRTRTKCYISIFRLNRRTSLVPLWPSSRNRLP